MRDRFPVPWVTAATLVVYVAFGATLGLAIGRVARVPWMVVLVLACAGTVLTLAVVVRAAAAALRGPLEERFDGARALRCSAQDAAVVAASAVRRTPGGGVGYVRRWAAWIPAIAWGAAGAVLLTGILNVTMRIEGQWIQWAGSGRDLDLRGTYRALDLGLLADPRDLRYGVVVGEVRLLDPARLMDVTVVDPKGAAVAKGEVGTGRSLRFAGARLYSWGYGPGLQLSVIQRDQGKLFESPVPLWPTATPGRYAERIQNPILTLELVKERWPEEAEDGSVHAVLASGNEVLFDGRIEPHRAYEGKNGYGLVSWEARPWVGLGVEHRVYRTATLVSLAVLAAALVAVLLLPARPFWYRNEPGGGAAIWPPSAWAALEGRRG